MSDIAPGRRDANAEALIKRHEGFRRTPYRDTAGHLTIGYGSNLEKGVPTFILEQLFQCDVDAAYVDGFAFEWFVRLDDVRCAVVLNMLYNIGQPRFRTFVRFIAALEAGEYSVAADEMLDSKWARQVGDRATELAEMMRTGQWPEWLGDDRT